MKFVSFLLKGQPKFGVSDGKNITDLTGKIKGAQTLKELIVNKSINEAKIEISDILKRLEDSGTDLENSKKDYERLLLLNNHVDNIFKEKLTKIHSIGKKK